MKLARAMISEPSGSDKSEKRDSDVKTLAVSRVAPLPLFFAMAEKTAKVAMGDTTGEMYAATH